MDISECCQRTLHAYTVFIAQNNDTGVVPQRTRGAPQPIPEQSNQNEEKLKTNWKIGLPTKKYLQYCKATGEKPKLFQEDNHVNYYKLRNTLYFHVCFLYDTSMYLQFKVRVRILLV